MKIDSALKMNLHPAFMPLLYDYFMKCFKVFCVYLVFVCYLLDLFVQFKFFEYMILSS